MVMICGACGEKIEVKSKIADGQHVQCPFCGERTACNKPSRIELPTGTVRRNKSEPQTVEAPPVLKLNRPSDETGRSADLNAQAIMRRMQIENEERVLAERKENAARRKARLESTIKTVVISLVVGVCVAGGGWWYMKWQAEKRARDAEIIRLRQIKEKEEAKAREKEEVARKQETAEREKAREQERARRKQEEVVRKAEQETAQRVAAENAAAVEAGKKRFAKAMDGFSEAVVLPWRSLPKRNRPGAVDGVFVCLSFGADGREEVFDVTSKTGGACEVVSLSSNGDVKKMDFSDLVGKMNKLGGMLRDDSRVYLFCPKEQAKSCPIPTSGAVNPAELRLGTELYRFLYTKKKMSKDCLVFETLLNVPGVKQPLPVKTVAFGETIRSDEMDEMMMDVARTTAPKSSKKPRKRTVVMYDGSIVKRQLGVTLVPRSPRNYDSNYASLAAEARRQESEEREHMAEGRRMEQEAVSKKFQLLRELATLTITEKAVDAGNVPSSR